MGRRCLRTIRMSPSSSEPHGHELCRYPEGLASGFTRRASPACQRILNQVTIVRVRPGSQRASFVAATTSASITPDFPGTGVFFGTNKQWASCFPLHTVGATEESRLAVRKMEVGWVVKGAGYLGSNFSASARSMPWGREAIKSLAAAGSIDSHVCSVIFNPIRDTWGGRDFTHWTVS